MIPFVDLQSQYKKISSEVEAAVLKVLRGGQYILGPEVGQLESALASFAGVKHAVSCASGTDALVIALMAEGVGPGDAIFTPPFTFFATAESIALVGATPVFVDIELSTFNIDPRALERKIAETKARKGLTPRGIMAVDLFGLPADYDRINEIARREGLFVIEDAAQSFGAEYNGRRAGALAEIGCTSFFPAKPLGAYGDGGALFTDDDKLADLFRSIRVHGQGADRYENVRLGLTGRLDSIQAAVLLAKLAIFPQELQARQQVAEQYARLLREAGSSLVVPAVPGGYRSAWAQYSVLAKDAAHRQALIERLKQEGVPTAIYYTKPLHLQKAFAHLHHSTGEFPVSEDASSRIFSLPMHPYLDEGTIRRIVGAIGVMP